MSEIQDKIKSFFLNFDGMLREGWPPDKALREAAITHREVYYPQHSPFQQTPMPLENEMLKTEDVRVRTPTLDHVISQLRQSVLESEKTSAAYLAALENSQTEKVADLLDQLIDRLQQLKPDRRGEIGRYYAIVITQLEQAKAMYRTFILGDDD